MVEAATAIAAGACRGVDRPEPAEVVVVAGGDDRYDAGGRGVVERLDDESRFGSTSGSPIEKLMTFIPSATAWSIALAISGELPSRPKPGVGTVSAL